MKTEKDDYREDRIAMRAVVDAYGPEEQAIGWYYYLENELVFPFRARCRRRKTSSPLKENKVYEIVAMAHVDERDHDIYVMVDFGEDQLAVFLSQMEPVCEIGSDTCEAILDWHYWVERGYRF